MNTQNLIKSLFARSRVVVSPEVDERMSRSALAAFDGAAGVRAAGSFRKTTVKIAAGIVVLATIAGLLTRFGVAFDGSQAALAQVRRALNEAAWVHVTMTETRAPGQVREHELWFSPQRQIRVSRSGDPNMPTLWSDFITHQRQCYEPKSGGLTLSYEYQQTPPSHDLPWGYLGYIFGDLPAHARVTEELGSFEQTKARVYHVAMEENDGVGQFTIFTARASDLPIAMTAQMVDATGQLRAALNTRFEYPAAGPRDIYDVGVPRTVTVIDERPTPEVEEFARLCKAYRASLQSYVFVVVMTGGRGTLDQMEVSYVQGDTALDGRQWKSLDFSYVPWPPMAPRPRVGAFDSVDDVLTCIEKDDGLMPVGMALWDGRYQYSVRTGREPAYRKSRDVGGRRDLHGFAWPCYLPSGRIVDDEYSKTHGLLCWKPGDGRTMYFDPKHDYVCVRSEQRGGTLIWDTVDFARTKTGLWYPRTVQLAVVQQDAEGRETSREVTHIDRLFVKPVPEFPAETFDPRNVPKTIAGKRVPPRL